MKTVRVSRQGFPVLSMHSYMRFVIFILTKRYNVVVDDKNPDIIFYTNYQQSPTEYDSFLKCVPKLHDRADMSKKFVFLSGEHADFQTPILSGTNQWGMGYQKFNHGRYVRMPSYVIDSWTMFDESRVVDTPFDWMLKQSKYEDIKHQFTRFCSVTQASSNVIREQVFDALSTYKLVTSSGPWRQNLFGEGAVDKYQWIKPEMNGRWDGLTYREKMEFFKTCKFNMCIAYGEADYRIEEKLPHAFFTNTIPLFHGNRLIEEDGINPYKIINLHKYQNDDWLRWVKKIDTDEKLHKQYIEEPIFVDNKLPIYFNTEYLLEFLSSVVEA